MLMPARSLLSRAKQLAADAYADDSPGYRKKQLQKVLLNIWFNPGFSTDWFQRLSSGDLQEVFRYRKRLYIKPYRPYINIRWSKPRKVKVIRDSYEFLKTRTTLYQRFLDNEAIMLAQLKLKDGTQAALVLDYQDRFRKEGEFTLSLQHGGRSVVTLAFSVERMENGEFVPRVGCIQGHSMLDDPGATRALHKLMYGLRPKSFIVYSAQKLFDAWGMKHSYFVSNRHRAHLGKRLIRLPWLHDIAADYDRTWLELGAREQGDGWYRMDGQPRRKPLESIKSKKRSEYRKRYALLDDVFRQIDDH